MTVRVEPEAEACTHGYDVAIFFDEITEEAQDLIGRYVDQQMVHSLIDKP